MPAADVVAMPSRQLHMLWGLVFDGHVPQGSIAARPAKPATADTTA